ncbi:MAG: FtsW/RodA/SpoVE family cell cycle protein [Oscillospiraceae bacterium]|jgi:rod shape determining protein RodA
MKEIMRELKDFFRQADLLLLLLCCLASIYGLILISSAVRSFGNTSDFILVQSVAIILGIGVYIGLSLIDIELITRQWKWLLLFNILFIMSLTVFGVTGDTGNRSWIRFGFIPGGVQPAEVVKITFVVLLAKQLSHNSEKGVSRISSVLSLALHLVFMVGLIVAVSSDLGVALIYVFIFLCMLFAAGVRLHWFVIAGVLVYLIWPYIWDNLLRSDQRDRIMIVFDPSIDPDNIGVGWQAAQSKIAIGAGRIFGMGLYKGTQIQYNDYLPAKHTDFIFAVAGEELGLIGCSVIVLLLSAIIIRCIWVGLKSKDSTSTLICIGFAGMLVFQTFENIGMCLGLTPIIGLTLPFFSYGGTSIITLFAAMGLVSSVKMHPLPPWRKYRT